MAMIQSQINMGQVLSQLNAGAQNTRAFNMFCMAFGKGMESSFFKMEQDLLQGAKALGSMGVAEMLLGMTNSSNSPIGAIFTGVFNKDDLFSYSMNTSYAGGGNADTEGGGGGGAGSNHAFPGVGSAGFDFASNASGGHDVPMATMGLQTPMRSPGMGNEQGAGVGHAGP